MFFLWNYLETLKVTVKGCFFWIHVGPELPVVPVLQNMAMGHGQHQIPRCPRSQSPSMKGLMATELDLVTRILPGKSLFLYSYIVVSCLDSLKQVFILLKCKLFLVWWIHYRNLKEVFILLKCKPGTDVLDFRTTSRVWGKLWKSRRHALRIAWLAFMTLMAMGAWNPRAPDGQVHGHPVDWDDWEW